MKRRLSWLLKCHTGAQNFDHDSDPPEPPGQAHRQDTASDGVPIVGDPVVSGGDGNISERPRVATRRMLNIGPSQF
jgi:hypothetical protein